MPSHEFHKFLFPHKTFISLFTLIHDIFMMIFRAGIYRKDKKIIKKETKPPLLSDDWRERASKSYKIGIYSFSQL